jgi:hypothetical protein
VVVVFNTISHIVQQAQHIRYLLNRRTFNILLRNTTTGTNIAEEIFTGATFQPTLDTDLPTSVDYGGWYRVSITATSGITSGDTLRTYVYANDGGALMIYGAQVEAGSYPTSYIPTYGSAVTRSNDSVSTLTLQNATSLWSCFIDIDFSDAPIVSNKHFFSTRTTTGLISWRLFDNNGVQAISPFFEGSGTYPFDTNIADNRTDGRVLLRCNGEGSYTYFRSYLGELIPNGKLNKHLYFLRH